MQPISQDEIVSFESPTDWRRWLGDHVDQKEGIWLRMYKKHSGVPSINYAEALDEALCYGWIDGQVQKMDEQSWLQRFTPRRPRSKWSMKNTKNAERLIAEGRMAEPGLRQIEAAKQDGRWDAAYEGQRKGTVPEDFLAELKRHPRAWEFYQTLNKTNTYAIYYRLHTAKKPETRENRKKMIIAMLEKQQKLA